MGATRPEGATTVSAARCATCDGQLRRQRVGFCSDGCRRSAITELERLHARHRDLTTAIEQLEASNWVVRTVRSALRDDLADAERELGRISRRQTRLLSALLDAGGARVAAERDAPPRGSDG